MGEYNDTVALSFDAMVCLTQSRRKPTEKEMFLLPKGTEWFDAYLQVDAHDCSDDAVYLLFNVEPMNSEDEIIEELSLYLGSYDRKELKAVLCKLAAAL